MFEIVFNYSHVPLQPFYGPFSGTTRLSQCQKRNFWTLWCKGRLTEADTLTIRLGATPSGLSCAHLHHAPYFLQAGCPSCRPTNIVTEQYAYSYKETLVENINVSGGITLAKNSWISINITVGYV